MALEKKRNSVFISSWKYSSIKPYLSLKTLNWTYWVKVYIQFKMNEYKYIHFMITKVQKVQNS